MISLVTLSLFGTMFYSDDKIDSGHFVTQNLRGDTIDTWLYWKIADADDPFHIHIVNDAKIDESKMGSVLETILSTDSIQVDDLKLHKGPAGQFSTFYKGWAGALNSPSLADTKNPLLRNLHVHETTSKDGDIIIILSPFKSTERVSGYTRSLTHDNQILQSYITIYQADILSESQISTILRHELGHAFGLKHSTDPDDLMHDKISTEFPYISDCAIEALKEAYNQNTNHIHACQK